MPAALDDELREFIVRHFESATALEVLLTLHAEPAREWEQASVAERTGLDPTEVGDLLAYLYQRGFLALAPGPSDPARFLCQPHTPDLARLLAALAEAYRRRPAAVIDAIFVSPARAARPARAFADAFRIRKDRSDG